MPVDNIERRLWFSLGDAPTPLAFDHDRILADAVAHAQHLARPSTTS